MDQLEEPEGRKEIIRKLLFVGAIFALLLIAYLGLNQLGLRELLREADRSLQQAESAIRKGDLEGALPALREGKNGLDALAGDVAAAKRIVLEERLSQSMIKELDALAERTRDGELHWSRLDHFVAAMSEMEIAGAEQVAVKWGEVKSSVVAPAFIEAAPSRYLFELPEDSWLDVMEFENGSTVLQDKLSEWLEGEIVVIGPPLTEEEAQAYKGKVAIREVATTCAEYDFGWTSEALTELSMERMFGGTPKKVYKRDGGPHFGLMRTRTSGRMTAAVEDLDRPHYIIDSARCLVTVTANAPDALDRSFLIEGSIKAPSQVFAHGSERAPGEWRRFVGHCLLDLVGSLGSTGGDLVLTECTQVVTIDRRSEEYVRDGGEFHLSSSRTSVEYAVSCEGNSETETQRSDETERPDKGRGEFTTMWLEQQGKTVVLRESALYRAGGTALRIDCETEVEFLKGHWREYVAGEEVTLSATAVGMQQAKQYLEDEIREQVVPALLAGADGPGEVNAVLINVEIDSLATELLTITEKTLMLEQSEPTVFRLRFYAWAE